MSFMAGPRKATRRVVMERWLVSRENPDTGDIDTYEVTCERGTFLTHYRLLGQADEAAFVEKTDRVLFDPMVDKWDKELLDSWLEAVEIRQR